MFTNNTFTEHRLAAYMKPDLQVWINDKLFTIKTIKKGWFINEPSLQFECIGGFFFCVKPDYTFTIVKP